MTFKSVIEVTVMGKTAFPCCSMMSIVLNFRKSLFGQQMLVV